jgi:uncharacterized damage-inducible protein DinB
MTMRDIILPEFDHEMANTRRTLERIPDNKFSWKPHDKSFTMQDLASHLANMPTWTGITLTQDSFDVAPPGGEPTRMPQAKTTAELLETFDKNVADARQVIEAVTDEDLQKPWTLLAGGKEVLTMPRAMVLRSFILNHNVHHRGQLTVYLRLNDLPVPAIYGSSADEEGM